jgi:hypothetical protein
VTAVCMHWELYFDISVVIGASHSPRSPCTHKVPTTPARSVTSVTKISRLSNRLVDLKQNLKPAVTPARSGH